MNKDMYTKIENHMLSLMKDSAHDCQHIYRVLYYSLEISREMDVEQDILIAAALLHDIGRAEEYRNRSVDHALAGAEMAYRFLLDNGWTKDNALQVRNCIASHRYRNDIKPATPEAEILFDADKLDATGSIGIARTIQYKALVGQPLYTVGTDGQVSGGEQDNKKSVFQEYNWKLKGLYDKFYTARAKQIALGRRQAAIDCYNAMFEEVQFAHSAGTTLLDNLIKE
jgi:uncharacterized protein